MASRTQLRLQQLTGSAVDIKNQALAATSNNNFAPGTAAALTGSSATDLFGMVGSALNRIHGAASSEPFNNTAGHFLNANSTDGSDDGGAIKLSASAGGIGLAWADDKNLWAEGGKIMMVANENDANAIKLHADAGANQQITVLNDAGTNEAAIALTSTAGGVDIDAAAAKNVDISGGQVLVSSKDNAASAIALTANVGTTETIVVTNTKGTAAGAISLVATAGGVLIDQDSATKKVHVDSEGAVDVDAVKGITITNAAGAAGDDITIENTNAENASVIITAAGNGTGDGAIQVTTTNAAGEITITSAHTAGRALHIDANANAGSIVDIDAGILDIDVTGVASLDSGDTLSLAVANSGVAVNIGHATSEVTIGDNLTVTGDLIVQGATTTVSSSNMVIQDSIIGLGFSGSDDSGTIFGNAGQRAVVFGRSANQHDFLPALNYDGTGFVLGTFNASPSSGTMGAAQAGIELRAGHLKPISSDGATLGDANEMWSDLFLANGAVVNFNNGNFKLTHTANALTIDTSDKLQFRDSNSFIHSDAANDLLLGATDITLDAAADVILDTTGVGKAIRLKQTGTEYGFLSGTLTGETQGLIISSSAGKAINYDSNGGMHMFDRQGTNAATISYDGSELTFGPSNGLDMQFVNDQMDAANEIFRIDASAESLLMASGKQLQLGAATEFLSGTDNRIAIQAAGAGDGSNTNAAAIQLNATGGGIGLSWNNSKDLWMEGGKAIITANENGSEAIKLHADAGVQQTILLQNDQGNTVTAIQAKADAGGIKLHAGMDNAASIHLVGYGMTFDGGDQNDSFLFNNSPIEFENITAPTSTTNKLYANGGTLYFNGSELGGSADTRRSLMNVTGSVTAGTELIMTGSGAGSGAGFNAHIDFLDSSDAPAFNSTDSFAKRGRLTEIYVNGQLMISGSVANVSNGTRDYRCVTTGSVKFAFALEADDMIQVITR
jgi:hypothetical protein